jgi:hypothetical protein
MEQVAVLGRPMQQEMQNNLQKTANRELQLADTHMGLEADPVLI